MTDQEREFQWWQTGLYCDRNTPEGGKQVELVMNRVLASISSDDEKLKTLESALFTAYVSFGDNKAAMRALCGLVESQLRAVFEREQRICNV